MMRDGDEAVIVDGDARKGRHWLSLAAASHDYNALRIEATNVLRAHYHAIGYA